jgi:hypothetical protein
LNPDPVRIRNTGPRYILRVSIATIISLVPGGRTNQAKENEEKLATLKRREERQREEAEKKRKEAELRMRQAEERRRKEEEERKAKAEEEAARVRYREPP